MSRILSKSEFSRLCDVSAAAITKACRIGGPLELAVSGTRVDANHPAATAYIARLLKAKETIDKPKRGRGRPTKKQTKVYLDNQETKAKEIQKKIVRLATKPTKKTRNKSKKATAQQQNQAQNEQNEADLKAKEPEQLAKEPEQIAIPDNIVVYADMTLREIFSQFGTDTRFLDFLRAVKQIEDIQEKRVKNAEKEGTLVSRRLVKVGIIDPINTAHQRLLRDASKTIAKNVWDMAKAGIDVIECETYIREQMTSFIRPVKDRITKTIQDI